ncbi:MAG: PIN domain-containing protein, partial [Archaeoglobaceae archaeon]
MCPNVDSVKTIQDLLTKGYRVFIDTNVIMNTNVITNHFFASEDTLQQLKRTTKSSNNKIIVVKSVREELEKLSNDKDTDTREKAEMGKSLIEKLKKEGIIQFVGTDMDSSFADKTFLSRFLEFSDKFDIALITSDRDLAYDVSDMNPRSVEIKRDIRSYYLKPTTGELIDYNKKSDSVTDQGSEFTTFNLRSLLNSLDSGSLVFLDPYSLLGSNPLNSFRVQKELKKNIENSGNTLKVTLSSYNNLEKLKDSGNQKAEEAVSLLKKLIEEGIIEPIKDDESEDTDFIQRYVSFFNKLLNKYEETNILLITSNKALAKNSQEKIKILYIRDQK